MKRSETDLTDLPASVDNGAATLLPGSRLPDLLLRGRHGVDVSLGPLGKKSRRGRHLIAALGQRLASPR
jgi:hypothetical protein